MKNKILKYGFVTTICYLFCNGLVFADTDGPYLYILGVAQDAGYPQTGCYQEHCMPGWKDAGLRRNAVSLGMIDPGTNKKYIFDATPGFPEQLY